jgi:hypothetical protein
MSNEDKKVKVDVDFNEALRRIAHTPKSVIDKDDDKKKESVPPKQDDTEKVDKQSHPKK